MTVKDTFETAGMRTTCGFEDWDHVDLRLHHNPGAAAFESARGLLEYGDLGVGDAAQFRGRGEPSGVGVPDHPQRRGRV